MAIVDNTLAKIRKLSLNLFTGKTELFCNNKIFSPTNVDKSQHLHLHLSPENLAQLNKNSLESKELLSIIQKYIADGGEYIFPDSPNTKNLEKVSSVIYDRSKQTLLEFIQRIIPRQDHGLWVSALAIRTANNMEEIKKIKLDMVYSAGHRGANIANLCNAQYLESKIIPLYNKFFELPNGLATFLASYERIVSYPVFAVFVGETQSQEEILEEIRTKITMLLKGGDQYQLDIHGINVVNVNKIKVLLPIITNEYEHNIEQKIEQGREGFIKVQIILKQSK
ncbi:hypothetical protein COT54_02875 [Candidatus Collierbacteria bacterium CG09_land_8_20_14_0_10_46_12]|uniref:Uncharacterized protein n=1 Tax=Candidatus Collierbacteria bacterium CG09_land_8_20_14_0_10_46_12 TaxID=1974533 RepID=A0A2H0WYT6_9BACT|nr:MAG: hypothetical protein COT54_02875 [Candidatus Collierbacteria bacterium CG09_land_8_20_14_0_10_46_12]